MGLVDGGKWVPLRRYDYLDNSRITNLVKFFCELFKLLKCACKSRHLYIFDKIDEEY
jgi:hypothetical protein